MKRYDSDIPIKIPLFKEENGFHTTPQRSKIMRAIKGKHSKPEIILRKALWHFGYRYRINDKNLPGRPDIVFKKFKVVIFVDGEYWHGYDWEARKNKIKTNAAFWVPKIERNMQRDRQNNLALCQMGYTVLRFWSKRIQNNLVSCLKEIIPLLTAYKPVQE